MIWEKLITSIKEIFGGFSFENKRSLAVICTALFSVILTIAVIISLSGRTAGKERKTDETDDITVFNIPIPPEELFLPDEPDFLPGVLLDRERREVWTDYDVMEFWQDPLREGEEPWRKKIEDAVDKILESIP